MTVPGMDLVPISEDPFASHEQSDRNGKVIRLVRNEIVPQVELALQSRVVGDFIGRGDIISTKEIERAAAVRESSITSWEEAAGLFIEHERIPFFSYPYEWSAPMVHAAGMLTLNLADKLFESGLGLQEATPFNILFRGARPVYSDFISIEARTANDPLWLALNQFVSTYINPLLVQKFLGGDLAKIYLSSPNGLTSSQVYEMVGPIRRFLPPFLGLVTIPTFLERLRRNARLYHPRDYAARSPKQAKFIFRALIRVLRQKMELLTPKLETGSWYEHRLNNPYNSVEMCEKKCAVEEVLSTLSPGRLLDVGCNTGQFSFLAAENHWSVVAVDSDPAVIGELWKKASVTHADVLPLVQNITQPAPGVGWMNRERQSFLQRARGNFDLVMMLAVMHYLLEAKISLDQVIQMARQLTRKHWLVELVLPKDPAFAKLIPNREAQFKDLTFEQFEQKCLPYFEIESKRELIADQRRLYLMRKRV